MDRDDIKQAAREAARKAAEDEQAATEKAEQIRAELGLEET